MKRLALALVFLLAACGGNTPTTPAQIVFAAKADYGVALTLAVGYKEKTLAICAAKVIVCGDPKVVAILQQADNVALATLNNAETAVRDPNAGGTKQQQAALAAQSAVKTIVDVLAAAGVH